MLTVPVVPGGHPLRALATADGAVPSLGPAWAEISRDADPVYARSFALQAVGTEWQWTALPADYAGMVAASGLLQQSTRLVTQGGAYVESLRGRCAARDTPLPIVGRHITCRTGGFEVSSHSVVAACHLGSFCGRTRLAMVRSLENTVPAAVHVAFRAQDHLTR